MGKFSYETEQEIVSRYISGESTLVLGRVYGTDRKIIRDLLTKHQVERRRIGERPLRSDAKLYGVDPDVLRSMVEDGMYAHEIGSVFGMVSSAIQNTCKRYGIKLKSRGERAFERRNQIPATLFTAPLSANESWLLGLLLTDGYVSGKECIGLGLTDKDGVYFASQIIGFGSIKRYEPRASEYNGKVIQGQLPLWKYTACSIELIERLEKFGLLPRKTKTLTFPNTTEVKSPDFIRGLWDGDGSWYIDKRDTVLCAHFGCASEQFTRALHSITTEVVGSTAKVRPNSQGNFWQFSYYGSYALTLARWLYYDTSVTCLERKKNFVAPFL